MEFRRVIATDLSIVSYLCLWGVSKQQKEAMKDNMEKRLNWVKQMLPKGLEIVVALSSRGGRRGLIEYLPIELAPEAVKGKSSLFVNCIWVLPRFMNTGVGRELMQRFLDEAGNVGGASVLSYEGDKWFGYFDYMPTDYFKQYGFKEVARDETRVLLHLDLGAHITPKLLAPKTREIKGKGKTIVEVFCNNQCPWCGWMADEIERRAKNRDIVVKRVCTDSRGAIEEFGLARGVSINGVPTIKRMAPWMEIRSALERATGLQ